MKIIDFRTCNGNLNVIPNENGELTTDNILYGNVCENYGNVCENYGNVCQI